MTSAETQGWRVSRARGLGRFLVREAFRGFVGFFVTSSVLWWMAERMALPGAFVRRLTLVAFVIWVGGEVVFGSLWWQLQQWRYDRRMQAEARGELPHTAGA